MRIGTREVGPGQPAFVVAEGGSNHGGSLEAALALTNAAASAGADAMKWQLWLSADELYDRGQFPAEWEATQRYTLPVEWLPQLRDRAHERGMAFGLSSFGFGSLDQADKWVDFHKVASIESGWTMFVEAVAKKGKPLLISTGMSSRETGLGLLLGLKWQGAIKNDETVWLQCAVSYPAAIEDCDLRAMTGHGGRSLPDAVESFTMGYSDHTLHPTIAPCAAVSLGACVIEKHLRLSREQYGFGYTESLEVTRTPGDIPDYLHSIAREDFETMVTAIRLTELALGSRDKRIRDAEQPYLKYRRGPRGLRGA